MRFTSNLPVRRCEFEPAQARDLTQPQIEQWASLPIEQPAQVEDHSIFIFFNGPLHLVGQTPFHDRQKASLDIGREDRQFQFAGE
jgi:hypothetical protein